MRTIEEWKPIYEKLLQAAGPTPWYARLAKTPIGFHWEEHDSASVLVKGEVPVVALPYYVWHFWLTETNIAFWYCTDSGFVIEVLDLTDAAAVTIPKERRFKGISSEAMNIASCSILRHPEGQHQVQPLDVEHMPEEVLLIGKHIPDDSNATAEDAIYSFSPNKGLLTVFPQLWFTAGSHDMGYCWITHVSREPKTSRIVGAGFRIKMFVLDESCKQIEDSIEPSIVRESQ
jgi:hypothetical protein